MPMSAKTRQAFLDSLKLGPAYHETHLSFKGADGRFYRSSDVERTDLSGKAVRVAYGVHRWYVAVEYLVPGQPREIDLGWALYRAAVKAGYIDRNDALGCIKYPKPCQSVKQAEQQPSVC